MTTLSKAKIATLHKHLNSNGVELKLSTLQNAVAEVSHYTSKRSMFALEDCGWGSKPYSLSSTKIVSYDTDIIVHLNYGAEDYECNFTVDELIDNGFSIPQEVAVEFAELICDSTDWALTDIFGDPMSIGEAYQYIASIPNAPFRIMMHTAYAQDELHDFIVSFDDNNIVLHDQKVVFTEGKPAPYKNCTFSSPEDFIKRINNSCQVFERLIIPFVTEGSKFEYLTTEIHYKYEENEYKPLTNSNAVKVLELEGYGTEFQVSNHLNVVMTKDEALDYLNTFWNYPLVISKVSDGIPYVLSDSDKGFFITELESDELSKDYMFISKLEDLPPLMSSL